MRFGYNFGLLGSGGGVSTYCWDPLTNAGSLYGKDDASGLGAGTLDPEYTDTNQYIYTQSFDNVSGLFTYRLGAAGDEQYRGLNEIYIYSTLQSEPVVMTWSVDRYTGTDLPLAQLLDDEAAACLNVRTMSKLSAMITEDIAGSCDYTGGATCVATSTYSAMANNAVGEVTYAWTVTGATLATGQDTDTITVTTDDSEDTTYTVSCEISDELPKIVTASGNFTQLRAPQASLVLSDISELTYIVCEPVPGQPCTMTSTYDVTAVAAHGTVDYVWTIVGDATITEQSGNTCTVTTSSDTADTIVFDLTCTATDDVSSAVSTDTFSHTRVSDNFCVLQGESADGLWRGASDSGPFGDIDPAETQFGLHVYALKWLDGNIGDGTFRMRFGVDGDTQIPDTDLIKVTINNRSVVMVWDEPNGYYEGTNTPMATVLWNEYELDKEICGLAEFLPNNFISYDFDVLRGTAVVTPIGG